MTTYCKLRSGEWGIKGEGLEEGKAVTVTTKAGVSKQVLVGKVIFTKENFCIAAIATKASAPKPEEIESKNCWECGFTFSKADCQRMGGDWSEGWCGC